MSKWRRQNFSSLSLWSISCLLVCLFVSHFTYKLLNASSWKFYHGWNCEQGKLIEFWKSSGSGLWIRIRTPDTDQIRLGERRPMRCLSAFAKVLHTMVFTIGPSQSRLCRVHVNLWTCSVQTSEIDLHFLLIQFLPRCMKCRRGLAMRFLSVCLSVKRVHCDKTEESYV